MCTRERNTLGNQLLIGLEQLDMNLELLKETHAAQGYTVEHPYTINTKNALKLSYVNEALKGLKK